MVEILKGIRVTLLLLIILTIINIILNSILLYNTYNTNNNIVEYNSTIPILEVIEEVL